MTDLSIVIPTFNEEENIYTNLATLHGFLSHISDNFEIIVVDDGSSDATCVIIEEAQKKFSPRILLISNPINQGKGAVVKQGMLASNGEYVFFTDADLPYELSFISTGLDQLKHNWEIVAGSRYESDKKNQEKILTPRTFTSKIFRLISHILIQTKANDTQCGFKGFRKNVAKKVFELSLIKGFGFDIEILFLANKFNFIVGNLPVSYSKESRVSRVRIVRDSVKIFSETITVLLNNALGKYP